MTQLNLPGNGQKRTETDALAEQLRVAYEPRTIPVVRGSHDSASALLVPQGMTVQSLKPILDAYRAVPETVRGTVTLADLASLVHYVKEHLTPATRVYVSPNGQVVAVLDDDTVTSPAWREHRATLALERSPAWCAWRRAHGHAQSQADFAALIEDQALDVLDPTLKVADDVRALAIRLGIALATPDEVIAASRGLKLRAEVAVSEAISLASGETELVYTEQHKSSDGAPLRVPTAFAIGVPVYEGGPGEVMLARLRYRRVPGQPRVSWTVTVHDIERIEREALRELAVKIAEDTGASALIGAPAEARR